jgi:ABC-type transporter Mla MlaB component
MIAPSSLHSLAAPTLAASTRATYVVDLIDLDAQLARSFTETMKRLGPGTGERIVVHLRHVVQADPAGVSAFAHCVEELQKARCDLSVVGGSRRIRTLLRAVRVPTAIAYAADRSASVRHVMIVRNSDPSRDCA